ncbi:MAG: GNAT family N-acetyltransferase, partial [Bacillales bacterium]|nr:GNAT family N-acetyltransferase [Bacillales bacterium]
GYALEATKAFVPAIMKKIKVKKVIGVCRADNIKSRSVLENSGFIFIEEFTAKWYGETHLSVLYNYELIESIK